MAALSWARFFEGGRGWFGFSEGMEALGMRCRSSVSLSMPFGPRRWSALTPRAGLPSLRACGDDEVEKEVVSVLKDGTRNASGRVVARFRAGPNAAVMR